jgi:2-polyprenyl-6-methoxyphenol hydroxylase-like FAD-dependent oxidoreductase
MSPTQHFGAAPHIDTKDMLLAREFDLSVSPRPEGAALPPPRVVVAGGSMGGCCAAIALRAAGCEVCDVYERTPGELPSQGAGLVIQPDIAAFLEHYSVCRVEDVAVRSSGRQYVDRRGAVIGGNDAPQLFSAWDVLHRALRAKVPQHHYHGGCAVRGVEAAGGGVALLLAGGGRVEADLLIGADG